MYKPIIGITTNFGDKGAELAVGYWESVRRAGGIPILLPPTGDLDEQRMQLEQLDGLLLSGGGDINPLYMGEEPSPLLHSINPRRDAHELSLVRLAQQHHVPIMGICRGCQVMAVALGGKVCQDIGSQGAKHSQDAPRGCATHTISITTEGILSEIAKEQGIAADAVKVNSFHHQAVTEAGPLMRVTAVATDGIIECIENIPDETFLLGVQWHPECLTSDDTVTDEAVRCVSRALFERFVEEAACYGHALEADYHINTLDSHCDTPMFFDQLLAEPEGLNLSRRRNTILMDAEKMDEGHLDEVFMVSYIPQGPLTTEGYADARQQVELTYARLDEMLRLTPELEGRVHRGIENGYALGTDISLVRHYQSMGCEYITLSHNGNNQICGSARPKDGENADMGLTDFGREVVREMNACGMLIDLSHTSEQTVREVLELSTRPVAVTHACCKALNPHPRNISDELLRAIADKGGVVQCTMYEGFCSIDGKASFFTFMEHLEHMIEVCGIDHVGIGSDFDGDGGVTGLADASYMMRITDHLLRRGYSVDDICKIWGDNFRRVLMSV